MDDRKRPALITGLVSAPLCVRDQRALQVAWRAALITRFGIDHETVEGRGLGPREKRSAFSAHVCLFHTSSQFTIHIGVPIETRANETRVAATPETVKKYVAQGYRVTIQSGAVACASFPDKAYTAVGAQIGDAASAFGAELALKVQSPTASELPFMKPGAVLGQVDVVLVPGANAAGLVENERIDVWNINAGERFSTYPIKGERGSGMISLNGSAAGRAQLDDQVIIAAFAMMNETELTGGWRPKLVFVDDSNKLKSSRDHVPTQSFIQQDVDTLTDRPMQV